jgi:hypothetical protein
MAKGQGARLHEQTSLPAWHWGIRLLTVCTGFASLILLVFYLIANHGTKFVHMSGKFGDRIYVGLINGRITFIRQQVQRIGGGPLDDTFRQVVYAAGSTSSTTTALHPDLALNFDSSPPKFSPALEDGVVVTSGISTSGPVAYGVTYDISQRRLSKPMIQTTSLTVIGVICCTYYKRSSARIRRRNGRCPTCNYDLRATPDRCPECGTHSCNIAESSGLKREAS